MNEKFVGEKTNRIRNQSPIRRDIVEFRDLEAPKFRKVGFCLVLT
jgi:hypothetical protein